MHGNRIKDCADPNSASLFTSVVTLRQFIDDTIAAGYNALGTTTTTTTTTTKKTTISTKTTTTATTREESEFDVLTDMIDPSLTHCSNTDNFPARIINGVTANDDDWPFFVRFAESF